MTILDEILAAKRDEMETRQRLESPEALSARADAVPEPQRGFRRALVEGEPPAVIAEIKRRSPSKGEIRPDFDPVACARAYAAGGAAAISVLTDEAFFGGHLDFLAAVRRAVPLPLLRKDFVIDSYQIDEARVAGADAVLLIVSALDDVQLASLHGYATERGFDVLVEVHDEAELSRALAVGAGLIGVNNRNLKTFDVDLAVTERLAARLVALAPDAGVTLIGESGIHGPEDVARLERAGATGYLVGESLMREVDLQRALERLRRKS